MAAGDTVGVAAVGVAMVVGMVMATVVKLVVVLASVERERREAVEDIRREGCSDRHHCMWNSLVDYHRRGQCTTIVCSMVWGRCCSDQDPPCASLGT